MMTMTFFQKLKRCIWYLFHQSGEIDPYKLQMALRKSKKQST